MTLWTTRFASGLPSGGSTAASCSVAKSAIEAPTGPDGVRPCAGSVELDTPCHRVSDHTKMGQAMARIIQKRRRGHQLANGGSNLSAMEAFSPCCAWFFLNPGTRGFYNPAPPNRKEFRCWPRCEVLR